MKEIDREFLRIYAAAVQGGQVESPQAEDPALWRLAVSQNALPFIAGGLKTDVPEPAKTEALRQIGKNEVRLRAVHKLIQKLQESGIDCVMMKGETLAVLYPIPDYRISGDCDLFVGENLDRALQVMKEAGCSLMGKVSGEQHVGCIHPAAGLLELHQRLHSEECDDLFFERASRIEEAYMPLSLPWGEVYTLGPTDNFIFIFFHFLKHFIARGGALRQISDILLYMRTYRREIDWDRVNRTMAALKYDTMLGTLVGIGVVYLGFADGDLPAYAYTPALCEAVLEDIFRTGLFGKKSGFSNVSRTYYKKRYEMFRDGAYEDYRPSWRKSWFWKRAFLNPKNLKLKYPYLQRTMLLVPVAILARYFEWFKKIITGRTAVSRLASTRINEADAKKLALLASLRMIDG